MSTEKAWLPALCTVISSHLSCLVWANHCTSAGPVGASIHLVTAPRLQGLNLHWARPIHFQLCPVSVSLCPSVPAHLTPVCLLMAVSLRLKVKPEFTLPVTLCFSGRKYHRSPSGLNQAPGEGGPGDGEKTMGFHKGPRGLPRTASVHMHFWGTVRWSCRQPGRVPGDPSSGGDKLFINK